MRLGASNNGSSPLGGSRRQVVASPQTVRDRIAQSSSTQQQQQQQALSSSPVARGNARGRRSELIPPTVATSPPPRNALPREGGLPPLASGGVVSPQPWVRKSQHPTNQDTIPRSQNDIINFADGGLFSDDYMNVEERKYRGPRRLPTPKLVRMAPNDDDDDSDDGLIPTSCTPLAGARSSSSSLLLNRMYSSQTMTPMAMSVEDTSPSKKRRAGQPPLPPPPPHLAPPSGITINTTRTSELTQPPLRAGVSTVLLKGFRLQNVLEKNPLVAFFQQCPLSLLEEAMSHRRTSVLQPQQFYQWCVHLLWLNNPNSAATSLQRNTTIPQAASSAQNAGVSSSPVASRSTGGSRKKQQQQLLSKAGSTVPSSHALLHSGGSRPTRQSEEEVMPSSSSPGRLRPLQAAGSYFAGRGGGVNQNQRISTTAGSSSDDDNPIERDDEAPTNNNPLNQSSTESQSNATPRMSLIHSNDRTKRPAVKQAHIKKTEDRQLVERLRTPLLNCPRPLLGRSGSNLVDELPIGESLVHSPIDSTLSPPPHHLQQQQQQKHRPNEISESDEELDASAKAKGEGHAMWRAHMQMVGATGGTLSATELAKMKRKVNHQRARKLRNYVRDVTNQSSSASHFSGGGLNESGQSDEGHYIHSRHRNEDGGGASASAILAIEDPVGKVMRGSCETVPFTRSEALELFQALDTHDDGVLDFRELCEGIICMRSADGAVIPFLHRFSTLVSPNIPNKDVRLVRISRQEVQYMATAALTVFLRRHKQLMSQREEFIVRNRLFAAAPIPFTTERADATIASAVASPVAGIPIDPLAVKRYLLVQFQSAHGHGKARVSSRISQSDFIFPQHEELYSRLESSKREASLWQRCGVTASPAGLEDSNNSTKKGVVTMNGSNGVGQGGGGDGDLSMTMTTTARVSQTQEVIASQRRAAEEMGRVNAIRAGMAAEAERRRVHDSRALFNTCPSLTDSIYALTLAHTGVEISRDSRTSEYSAHSTSTTSRTLKAIPAYANRCALLLTEVDRYTMLIKLLEQFVRSFLVECDEQLLAVVGQDPVSYQLMQSIAQNCVKCPAVSMAFGKGGSLASGGVGGGMTPLRVGRAGVEGSGGVVTTLAPVSPSTTPDMAIRPDVPLAPPTDCKPLLEYVRVVLPCEDELRTSFLADCYVSNDAEEGESAFRVMAKPHQITADRDERAPAGSSGGSPYSKAANLSTASPSKAQSTSLFNIDSPRVVLGGAAPSSSMSPTPQLRSPRAAGRLPSSSQTPGKSSVVIANNTYTIGSPTTAALPPQRGDGDDSTDEEDDPNRSGGDFGDTKSNFSATRSVSNLAAADDKPRMLLGVDSFNSGGGGVVPVTSSLSNNSRLHSEKHLAVTRKKITQPDMSRVHSPEFEPPEYVTMGGKLVELRFLSEGGGGSGNGGGVH